MRFSTLATFLRRHSDIFTNLIENTIISKFGFAPASILSPGFDGEVKNFSLFDLSIWNMGAPKSKVI